MDMGAKRNLHSAKIYRELLALFDRLATNRSAFAYSFSS